jgi:hypothetical protein
MIPTRDNPSIPIGVNKPNWSSIYVNQKCNANSSNPMLNKNKQILNCDSFVSSKHQEAYSSCYQHLIQHTKSSDKTQKKKVISDTKHNYIKNTITHNSCRIKPATKKSINSNTSQDLFPALPIWNSNHPLAIQIKHHHIQHRQTLYSMARLSLDNQITSIQGSVNQFVTNRSFANLLLYGSPINNSIFHSFLKYL